MTRLIILSLGSFGFLLPLQSQTPADSTLSEYKVAYDGVHPREWNLKDQI